MTKLRRVGFGGCTTATTALLLVGVGLAGQNAARADVNTFTLRQPLNNATVREVVPIRIPVSLLHQAGYATVTIDGEFHGAPAVPKSGDVIYRWDTKHSVASDSGSGTPPAPGQQQAIADGKHTIVVDLFDKESNEIAEATSTVRVSNKITTLPDGVHLLYKWRSNELLAYKVHTEIKNTTSGGTQTTDAKFNRSVEDINGDEILLRDSVSADGTIAGQTISSLYDIKAKYWTVNRTGQLLTDNHPISDGQHFGFPITALPARRVNLGDSWQTHLQVSLPWSSDHLTDVRGQARLDAFEWQDGYPTAKLVETYDGPAKFTITTSQGNVPDQTSTIHLSRTVWFAYEAGMVVRADTTITSDSQLTSAALAAFSTDPSDSAPNGGGYGTPNPYGVGRGMPPYGGGMPPGGMLPGGMPNGAPGSPYGRGLPPYGGQMPPYGGQVPPYGGQIPPPGSATSPYGGPQGMAGSAATQSTKLESHEVVTMVGVSST